MESEPDLKSAGLPVIFQRSALSFVPLKLLPVSEMTHGCGVWMFMIELILQSSSNWAKPLIPGTLYVVVNVKRCRMSKSLLAYSAPGLKLSCGRYAVRFREPLSKPWPYV